jgi:bacillithiol biosynthesis cysteine-adding enzyme BshC
LAHAPKLELHVDRPGGAPVVRDYITRSGTAGRFFAGHFADLASYRAKAEEVDRRFDREARERAASAIHVPEGADPTRLERFVEQGGYLVTTGQQPGLFGGPLFCVLKALTAARLAEALEARLERPVLPLFWVASEDHDWEEANHADIIGVDNELHRLELAAPDPDIRPSLHRVRLDGEVEQLVGQFVKLLPETEFSAPYIELIRAAFQSGGTVPDGFHATMRGLLGRFGIFFTDAADPALKACSSDLLLEELARSEELEGVLRRTADRLEADGYGLQVPILEGAVNVFFEGGGGRERLYRAGAAFRRRATGHATPADEVRAAAASDPSVLSPNVLLRPVVESAVFPTLSYVAGPGEMGYFAQLGDYFRAHGIEMPVVHPRWSVTVVESKIRKVLDKFGMGVEALDRPFHEIAGEVAREEVPAEVRAVIGKLKGAIGSGAGELQKAATAVDPTLKGPVQHMRSQALAAIDDVEKKVVQAVKRETDIALAQLEKAQVHLYPRGKPAERVQSPFYYLTRYGDSFLDSLHERFAVNLE